MSKLQISPLKSNDYYRSYNTTISNLFGYFFSKIEIESIIFDDKNHNFLKLLIKNIITNMIIHNKFKNDGINSKVEIELIISFNGKVHNLTLERINLRMFRYKFFYGYDEELTTAFTEFRLCVLQPCCTSSIKIFMILPQSMIFLIFELTEITSMIRIIILKLLIVKRYHFDTVFNGLDDELTTALRNYDYMCRSSAVYIS
uniref:Uncharacterized protein n=1 Tax=Rhizophagus irregularis (strain DAOM 181602 / DAOM 197198 / MUCL 43194) TaxID=747089 RepID=U9SV80_RHIID